MSREILFRGKQIDNGDWVQGYLFRIWERAYICWGTVNGVPDMTEVYPDAVCEYTGLTDKNGRKIFEGDIISGERYHNYGQGGECLPDKFVIKWNDKQAAFAPVYYWKGYNHDLKNYEVIGNIFDNPELWKSGNRRKG